MVCKVQIFTVWLYIKSLLKVLKTQCETADRRYFTVLVSGVSSR